MGLTHLDLFSGIGGFAYAADQVWDDVEHIFCEIDPFCQQVLKKHWPESEIYDDIRNITNTDLQRSLEGRNEINAAERNEAQPGFTERPFILTGGFPCQPFSQAGVRRGTSDERYLWPEMLRVIRSFQPQWVIAENVSGLLTMQEGLVFEQVCLDLESAGYEVQPFIIPAAAVNAPHRRDRVWFVANSKRNGNVRSGRVQGQREDRQTVRKAPATFIPDDSNAANPRRKHGQSGSSDQHGQDPAKRSSQTAEAERHSPNASDSERTGREEPRYGTDTEDRTQGSSGLHGRFERHGWNRNWHEVATELCSVDDGLPAELDGFKLSKSQHRKEQLKAYGNAIVPQVAVEIMKGMAS